MLLSFALCPDAMCPSGSRTRNTVTSTPTLFRLAFTALHDPQEAATASDSVPGPLPSQASPVRRPGTLRTIRSVWLRQGAQVWPRPVVVDIHETCIYLELSLLELAAALVKLCSGTAASS